jgi:hypothetical protein
MPPIRFRLVNQLIVPFACPKWEIKNIRVRGVSTEATYFESDSPCAYINRGANTPLRLRDIQSVWPIDFDPYEVEFGQTGEALDNIERIIKQFGSIGTTSEAEFLSAYFDYLRSTVEKLTPDLFHPPGRFPDDKADWVFDALLPLPQAHLYVVDPLDETWYSSLDSPQNMFKVDFAFWTGTEFIAVEIDGGSHIGSDKHITKDRMLQRSGVQVYHIMNQEVTDYGTKVVSRLLPDSRVRQW